MVTVQEQFLDLDATQLAQLIKNKTITALAATEHYIDHLKQVNPGLNFLVEERFFAAREEARRCDVHIASGADVTGRLFGVPISLKECFDMVGTKTTGGLLARQDYRPEQDADIVQRLKEEGAIVLGKTNTPALSFCQETDNKLYGRTNNPWDPLRTAGGSSGGEGALIAVGGAAVGIGSDIGGSIRFPAHFNGVVGFKSGDGQVSAAGMYPPFPHPLQARMLGIGAMAKSVRDARLINDIIALTPPASRTLQDFELVIPQQSLTSPLSEQTKQIINNITDKIQPHFATIDDVPPLFAPTATLWQLIMSIDGAQSVKKEAWQGAAKGSVIGEWLKERLFKSSEWHAYLTWALIGANLFKPSPAKLKEMITQVEEGDAVIRQYFAHKIAILPVYHSPALYHGQVYKEIFSPRKTYRRYMPYVAYANVWGLPALTVPVGEEDGLPVAVQIISNVGNEAAIFELGEWLEAQFRGWKRALI